MWNRVVDTTWKTDHAKANGGDSEMLLFSFTVWLLQLEEEVRAREIERVYSVVECMTA
jgi:hypothetical protein